MRHTGKHLTFLLPAVLLLSACLSGGGSSSRAPSPTPPPNNDPIPTVNYLSAIGIGVSDLDAAVKLYTQGLGMRELKRLQRDNRHEVILESADGRGSLVALMSFTDGIGRNVQQNPGKLVFYARDPNTFAAQFNAAGGRITLPPMPQAAFGGVLVGFGRDQDNNLIEIVGDDSANHSYFGAFGLGVSDLEAARDFYTEVLGLEQSLFLEIPGQYDEYILQSPVPGGSALVLMHWTNDSVRNYSDNPIKLEFASSDPQALAGALERSGMAIERTPAPSAEPGLENQLVGYSSDADGNLLELRQGIRGYLGGAGIGTDDLDAALRFYTEGLGMHEVTRRSRTDRDEVVLESADARGSQLVLMQFTDGEPRNMRRNPGKLVFYVSDPEQTALDLIAAGGLVTLPPSFQPGLNVVVGFGRDPDNNLIELVGSPAAVQSYFGAFGIGVSDLQAARDFYVDTLGLRQVLFLPIPGQYDEYILQGQGGSALVLMHWTNAVPRNYTDNPVKLEWRSMSPDGLISGIEQAGERVVQTPNSDDTRDDEQVAYAKDADGTLLEILPAPWGR
ncbi:VOC family protein [Pseudomonas jilinensis]|uniref:VOC domain-containing protein n=1 Tax=Pseudomonas jilinensis TaxID=2078689 RepID=A0A396RXB3_9PSED|nr:VOC family protein [Pseudomonas jilinensis]RHW20042.1 hypothetical protein C2846_15590 [Pseudomonas jilinensis]